MINIKFKLKSKPISPVRPNHPLSPTKNYKNTYTYIYKLVEEEEEEEEEGTTPVNQNILFPIPRYPVKENRGEVTIRQNIDVKQNDATGTTKSES